MCVLCTSQKPYGAHTTLASVAKLDGVHIRHYVSASCIVCTSRNPMSSIRHAEHVCMITFRHRAYCARRAIHWRTCDASVSCIGSNVVSIVHVAKGDGVHTTNCAQYVFTSCVTCTERNPMASIRYHAEALCVLCTSQKPDGAHTTLVSVAKLDGVHTTCKTYVFLSCVLCTSRNQMTFSRHLALSRYQMACIRHYVLSRYSMAFIRHSAKPDDV